MEDRIKEINDMLNEADDIDYGAIVKNLAGRPLSEKDREEVKRFNSQYDKAREMKAN